jgi:hypothetical protein
MESNKTALERAFELARSGRYLRLGHLLQRLRPTGYGAGDQKTIKSGHQGIQVAPALQSARLIAGVEFVAENGGGAGMRLRKGAK